MKRGGKRRNFGSRRTVAERNSPENQSRGGEDLTEQKARL